MDRVMQAVHPGVPVDVGGDGDLADSMRYGESLAPGVTMP